MIRRAVCAGLGLALLSWPTAAITQTTPNYIQVRQVECHKWRGTAFSIDSGHMVSAAHVTSGKECKVGGFPIALTEQNGGKDYSRLDAPGAGLRINCEGFKPGQWYYAVGYANGAPWQTIVPVYATVYIHKSGMRVLDGLVIPGQSGGPIVNSKGEAVGIVNARSEEFGVSFSRELKDTTVCQS